MKPTENKVPKHIGIILDGNRRLAKRLMMKPWKGHEWGAKKVAKLLEWAKEVDVKELTLYCFSVENFNRPKQEFDYLIKIFKESIDNTIDDPRIYENEVKVNIIGRLWMFPKDLQERMYKIMVKTKNHNKYVVNFAMAYGGRAEVTDAAKKIAQQVKDGKLDVEEINEEVFKKNLYMADEPDMIIRTGNVTRISNFLSFQGAYSEYFFLEKMWPEFEKEDLIECIEDYKTRKRTFGR
ncbi:di-trans,poly-cis-decaprenylcistransferase [Candidatus Woesearchaeota archaeon]|nr:di-trans,poly-cis-decaprenylcistransferase [Candidatus Woesearchaeota archaeon]